MELEERYEALKDIALNGDFRSYVANDVRNITGFSYQRCPLCGSEKTVRREGWQLYRCGSRVRETNDDFNPYTECLLHAARTVIRHLDSRTD